MKKLNIVLTAHILSYVLNAKIFLSSCIHALAAYNSCFNEPILSMSKEKVAI